MALVYFGYAIKIKLKEEGISYHWLYNSKQREDVNLYRKSLFVSVFMLICSVPVLADMFAPSPSCSKPYKPYQFTYQYQVDSFNDDVQSYKRCIQDFVDEQNDAVKKHQQAADDAIDEWNNFVNLELN